MHLHFLSNSARIYKNTFYYIFFVSKEVGTWKWVIKFDISSDTNWLFLFLRCWAIRMLSMWHDYILLPSPLFVNTPQSWMQGWKMFTQNMINKKLLDGITNSTRTLLISDENMYSNKYYVLSIMCFCSIEVYLGTIIFFLISESVRKYYLLKTKWVWKNPLLS